MLYTTDLSIRSDDHFHRGNDDNDDEYGPVPIDASPLGAKNESGGIPKLFRTRLLQKTRTDFVFSF